MPALNLGHTFHQLEQACLFFKGSLPTSLPPSLPHSLPPYLTHSLTPSLPPLSERIRMSIVSLGSRWSLTHQDTSLIRTPHTSGHYSPDRKSTIATELQMANQWICTSLMERYVSHREAHASSGLSSHTTE